MSAGTQIDFSKYEDASTAPPPQQIDFSKYESGQAKSGSPSEFIDPRQLEEQINSNPFRALQIPFEQLGKAATAEHDQIADQMLSDAAKGKNVSKADYVKSFFLGSGADLSKMIAGTLSPEGIGTGMATALAPEVMGPLMLAHGGMNAAINEPGAERGNPQAMQKFLLSGAEAAGGGAVTEGAFGANARTPIQDIWNANKRTLQQLTGTMQTPAQAAQVPPGSSFAPARQVSNQDVIDWSKTEGIDLTPAQETGNKGAKFVQGLGEQTLTPSGQPLQDALELNRGRVEQALENMAFRYDPNAAGATPESAGSSLQASAKSALQNAKAESDVLYKKAGLDSSGIAISDLRNRLAGFVDTIRNPNAPEYQTPSVEAALDDIESKIADPRLGPNATVQSARNLRTELWEKANDYSGNIPNAARAIYARASQVPDDAMMAAAQGTPFEQSFRDASAKWADIKSKFDTPGQPLNNLLQSGDRKQAYNSVVGGKSADVIQKLQDEHVDLSPVRSQVIRDIAGKNFRASGNTLAGYPDAFLQKLFGPAGTQELYTASEAARRLNVEVNPSGSGRLLIAKDQIGWNPASWVRGEAAARASMPRPAGATVGPTVTPGASYGGFKPITLGYRGLAGMMGIGEAGEGGE